MEKNKIIKKPLYSKGASIFKKMQEDKNAINKHLKNEGKLADIKINTALLSPYHLLESDDFSFQFTTSPGIIIMFWIIFIHRCILHQHKNCRYFVVPKIRTVW